MQQKKEKMRVKKRFTDGDFSKVVVGCRKKSLFLRMFARHGGMFFFDLFNIVAGKIESG